MDDFEVFIHDEVIFELDRPYMDVTGVEWRWTGRRDGQGLPLMASVQPVRRFKPVPLPDVYRDHGPLMPMPCARTLRAIRERWFLPPGTEVAS